MIVATGFRQWPDSQTAGSSIPSHELQPQHVSSVDRVREIPSIPQHATNAARNVAPGLNTRNTLRRLSHLVTA